MGEKSMFWAIFFFLIFSWNFLYKRPILTAFLYHESLFTFETKDSFVSFFAGFFHLFQKMKKSNKYKIKKILVKKISSKNCLPFQKSFGKNCLGCQRLPEPIKHWHQKPPVSESSWVNKALAPESPSPQKVSVFKFQS